jgi:hypothetical protein
VPVVVERALGIERHRCLRQQQQQSPPTAPSPGSPNHDLCLQYQRFETGMGAKKSAL